MNTDKIYAESIANEYSVKDTRKVVALRKLDRKAKRGSEIFAYTFGSIAALLLGVGMCCSMNVVGSGTTQTFVVGVILGILGIVGVSINYPLYRKIRRNGMNKYASDIVLLAKEISESK